MHKPTLGLLMLVVSPLLQATSGEGSFDGVVRAEWCNDGRAMRLLENFDYRDPAGVQWDASKGSVIDGASIPPVFWSMIGGPYEGKYRKASVVHDAACDRRDRSWKETHRMFYHACLCGGVHKMKAKIMFAAVYHFGPRWTEHAAPQPPVDCDTAAKRRLIKEDYSLIEPSTFFTSDDDYLRLRNLIERDPAISLERIERVTADDLRRLVPVPQQPPRRLNVELPD